MSGWRDSNRSTHLPPEFLAIRPLIKSRDGYRCTWIEAGQRCRGPADEVDHIVPGDDHRPVNLRSLCLPHHRKKSSLEGSGARWGHPMPRAQERHPGTFVLDPGGIKLVGANAETP